MPEKMQTPTNVSSRKRAQLDFIKELGETGDDIERIRKSRARLLSPEIKGDGHLENGEELEGRIVRESIGELLSDYAYAARKDGNKIRVSGALFKFNHSQIGRFGQKTISKKKEAGTIFASLDKEGQKMLYFDPFQSLAGTDAINRAKKSNNEQLLQDLIQRVDTNEQLISESDFEKKYLTDEGKKAALLGWMKNKYGNKEYETVNLTNVAQEEQPLSDAAEDQIAPGEPQQDDGHVKTESEKKYEESIKKLAQAFGLQYDSAKGFTPDYPVMDGMESPNEFEAVVAVEPPTDVYVDYNKLLTEKKPFLFSGWRKKPDYVKILDTVMKKSAAYGEIVSKGEADASALNVKYNPDLDPNVMLLRAQILHGIEDEQGHSFIRMVAKTDGNAYSSYSFGFWPLYNTPGTGAVTAGVVRNPDPYHDDPGIIERRFSISYANYLRAAAKIRGVVGSGRSYSFLGYNCTSFAADIAKEAGVPIKDKDSSETMQTFRYRSARIDSPYSLAKFVRAANKQKDLSKEVYARESALDNEMDARVKAGLENLSFIEQTDRDAFNTIKDLIEDEKSYSQNGQMKPQPETGKGGRVVKDDVKMFVENAALAGYMDSLTQNRLFRFVCESYGMEAEKDKVALQILDSVINYADVKLEAVDQLVDQEVDLDTKAEEQQNATGLTYQDADSDKISRKRKFRNAKRRELMNQAFGYRTVSEFLKEVVTNPEVLADTIEKIADAAGTAEQPKDTIYDIGYKNIGQYFIGIRQKVAPAAADHGIFDERVFSKLRLDLAIQSNSYYQEQLRNMGIVGADEDAYEEKLLSEIIRYVVEQKDKGYIFRQKNTDRQTVGLVNVVNATDQFRKLSEMLADDEVMNRIFIICRSADELKAAVNNGLKMPETSETQTVRKTQMTPETREQVTGSYAAGSYDFRDVYHSFGEFDRIGLLETAMKSFRDAILLPIYYSYLPEHRDPMDRFLSMNSAIEEYKLPLLVSALADSFIGAGNYLRNWDGRLDADHDTFFKTFFEEAFGLSESDKHLFRDEEMTEQNRDRWESNKDGIRDRFEGMRACLRDLEIYV